MKRFQSLLSWLDDRTGVKKLTHEALYENVPGGSRWRYVWGSTLTFTLVVQFITGIFLWMAYSPGAQTAWESVYYIQNEMTGGWLLRGIHHFTAQFMTLLLVLHLMQVLIDGAYRAPREMNYWFGLILLLLVLGLSLTGYLLPWDQKGYWATKVATSIMAVTPVAGDALQKIVVGGPDYGHHTLTRFFALHAGVIPGAIIALLVGHIYLFRRHGITEARRRGGRRRPDVKFWPDQVLKDAVACLAVMAAVLFCVLYTRFATPSHGVELAPPADPSQEYSAARPEWYFLFLFQFLKAGWLKTLFGDHAEVVGAMVIPGLVLGVIFAMPFIGKWRLGHRFNLGFICAIGLGAGLLTWQAVQEDSHNKLFISAQKQAGQDSHRIIALARARGIPREGAVMLLAGDPFTQGPKIFARNCASCHRYAGHDGLGNIPTDAPAAADLQGFGSREWLAGLLDPGKVSSTQYFGGTKFADGKMAKFVKKDVARYEPGQREKLRVALSALSAEAGLKSQTALDAKDANDILKGRDYIKADLACTDCHAYGKPDPDATAPDLTGWASREWLIGLITNPAHEKFYGKRNDRMPRFGDDKVLDAQAISLVADWLRGEWFEPSAIESAKR